MQTCIICLQVCCGLARLAHMNWLRAASTLVIASCLFFACTIERTVSADGSKPDFLRDVRPILADNCFRCHGADEQSREAGLRLDERESAVRGGDSGEPAFVAGKPDSSELVRRITSSDESERMPPAKTKTRLSPTQVETLRQWIADGAHYQIHWALVPPKRPPVPSFPDAHWGTNEIDQFVVSRLRPEHLSPSPEAARASLLRRSYLDLIGLPPSPADVNS